MQKTLPMVLAALLASTSVFSMTDAQRQEHLQWMQKNLPEVPTWNEWQKKTGALPPDFDALPRANYLPDPFKFQDGKAVKMPGDWAKRRAEIKDLFQKHVLGTMPPKPKLDRVTPVEEIKGNGYITRIVKLEYGPESKASTQVTLTIPEGKGPYPVLIGGGSWASSLIRRGYAAVAYSGSVDQESNLRELYPNYDFATMAQRAFNVQMVVDYLLTLPEIDKAKIAITGYSREGKMAATAAAMDERIAAVVAGSTGVGGVLAWRLSGERGMGEGIESTTRMFPLWFAPQMRYFSGHEDRLPVDANLLVAMIAPRSILMEYGLNDEVSNVWGAEQTYHSAKKVFDALGQPNRISLMRVPGFHGANDIEGCIDWLDIQFGRSKRTWENDLLFRWDYAAWRDTAGKGIDISKGPAKPALPGETTTVAAADKAAADTRNAITWTLGEQPPIYTAPAGGRGGPGGRGGAAGGRGGPAATAIRPVANPGQLGPDVPGWVIGRNSIEFGWNKPNSDVADSKRIRFGNITGELYFPVGTPETTKLPTVVWLHGYSYPLGYMWVYRRDLHPILALVKAGYAVLAYDQVGFGSRASEIAPFYDRYPRWSQLGKMVEDARAAIDSLTQDPMVDPQQISLFGYTLGGMVALHTAALDSRVKAVVSVSGFTPMRTDVAAKGTGGVGRFSVERPVNPRLGLYAGKEAQIPYDYDQLIASIAPRPVLVVQPSMDRDATPADVRNAVEQARKVYALRNAGPALALQEPNDYQRLPAATQDAAIAWMAQIKK